MQKETNVSHGLKWGVIIGIVYCLFLFLRYNMGGSNPMMLGLWTFIGYVAVLILLFICGIQRRKQEGGYIELKDAFQTMFIAVLGFEFFYMAFNFLYLKFINPDFFQNLKDSVEAYMIKNNVEQEQIDKALENFDSQAAKNMNLGSSLVSLAFSVAISGVFALIFALIIKKKREPFADSSFH
jgi:glucan phosphoethanolaminetransferase (alkaline phosphatase superfamily)